MFRCRCDTCDETYLKEDLESAQAVFNEHATQQHEVALQRVEMRSDEDEHSHGETTASETDGSADDRTDNTLEDR